MRNLASVQKIINLEPIEGADKILKATVLGWQCVVAKKDSFSVGDLVVYVEVDSVVPDREEFEFLRDRKFRVRTIKLRGQVSQGLVLPLTVLPKGKYKEGDDVTQILGVKKYDPEGEKEQKLLEEKSKTSKNKLTKFLMRYPWYRRLLSPKKSSWPSFIVKTDETRLQAMPQILEQEKNTLFDLTEKLDGQSATYFLIQKKFLFWKTYIFGVCSRNLYLTKPDSSSYWTVARQFKIEEVLKKFIGDFDYVVLQGEIIGEGIQKNKYGIKGYDFYAFNFITSKGKVRLADLDPALFNQGIKSVPFIWIRKLPETVQECVEMAKGKSLLADVLREGLVCRNHEKNISFKVINPDFLLKYEE